MFSVSVRRPSALRLVGVALMVCLELALIGRGAHTAFAATPSVFVPFTQPIGIAAAPGRLLVTPYCNEPRQIISLNSAGVASVFATLPPRGSGCFEDYIAISPGLGGFTANSVYVVQGTKIVKVSPDGLTVTTFATIPGLSPDHNGITFDHVGAFGFDMIVAGFNGNIFRVNAAGVATLVATVPGAAEGPDVAPLSFAPYGGQVLIADELGNQVWAISALGVVTPVVSFNAAESIHVIPPNPCSFGTSGGAFFTAIYPVNITKFPPSDFAGLSGRILVTSESGGIGLLTSTAGVVSVSSFQGNIGQHEGSAFVDCAVPSATGSADLTVDKFADPQEPRAGQQFTYTVRVKNNGPDSALNTVLTDTLPAGVTFVSVSPTPACSQAALVVTCNAGTLANGGSFTALITVTAPSSPGQIVNTARVSSDTGDPNSGNNTFNYPTQVFGLFADMGVWGSVSGQTRRGAPLTYTISVKNNGPDAATGVTLSDTFSAPVTFVGAATASQGTCTVTTTVNCTIGGMASGALVTVTFTVQATATGSLVNTATVAGTSNDPNSGNNTGQVFSWIS